MRSSAQWLNWRQFNSLRKAIAWSPAAEGVYAFGRRQGAKGLPMNFEWAYIGRSDNLRTRLNQHQIQLEKNSGLWRWFSENPESLEVWLALSSNSRRDEADLIRQIEPLTNKIRYIGAA